MNRSCVLPSSLLSLSALLAACGAPASKPAAEPAPAKTESASASVANVAKESAPKVDAAAKPAKEDAKGPLKFTGFPGPNVAPPKGSTLWVAAPVQNATWAESLGLFRAEVTKVDGNVAIVKGVKGEVHVPGAFALAPTAATYKKGQPVLVADNVSLISGASYGRIKDVHKEDSGTTYDVTYVFGGSSSDATVDAAALLALDDKLTLGAPAAFKDGDKWTTAMYVANGADKGKAWVITFGGHVEQRANVKALAVSKAYKKGDKVWAARFADLEPATITEVVSGGLQYKIKTAEGKEETVGLERLTSPL